MLKRIAQLMSVVILSAVLPIGVGMSRVAVAAEPDLQQAAEMLQDGFEALGEDDNDLAQQLFETLVQTYPGTKESQRAERELHKLGVTPQPLTLAPRMSPQDPVPMRADADAALRLKFAAEAGDRVFFAENSAVIGGRARAMIETQARWLAKRTPLKITIVGRADDSAPADISNSLSVKRAEAVRERLIAAGVPAARIIIEGRGTRDPVATCRSPICQAQNRHAETYVSTGIVHSERDDGVRDAALPRARGAAADIGAATLAR